jgi:DNA helicase HerA-like ATPase
MQIESQGGDRFFGEPMLNIADFMQTDSRYPGAHGQAKGVINVLAADALMNAPRLYVTFLLWMLSELFETLPEVGDLEKPKLVFFFDEAHLLFNDAPKVLVERIEPEHHLSFRWHPAAVDVTVDYSSEPTTLVEFKLSEVDSGTLLRVIESGFNQIPASRRAEAFRMNTGGWEEQMLNIEKYVAKG